MKERVKEITVFCTFERTIEVPEDIQFDEEAIEEFANEFIGTDEMLLDVSDSGISAKQSEMIYD